MNNQLLQVSNQQRLFSANGSSLYSFQHKNNSCACNEHPRIDLAKEPCRISDV